MKRSRLKLFRTTALTISLIAVILIVISIGVLAFIGITDVTDSVTNTVKSGASYDSLNQLKSEYNNLSKKYDALDKQLGKQPDINLKTAFNNGKLKLSKANQTLSGIDSDIAKGKPEDSIKEELNKAEQELKEATDIYNQFVKK